MNKSMSDLRLGWESGLLFVTFNLGTRSVLAFWGLGRRQRRSEYTDEQV
jgi:hypothetical protein